MNTYLIYGHDNKLLCEIKAAKMFIDGCDDCHSDFCKAFYCFTDDSGENLEMYLGCELVHHMIMIDSMGYIHNDIGIPFPEVLE